MSPDTGGDDTTQGLTPFACKVALTATSGQGVRGGFGDSIATERGVYGSEGELCP